MPVEVGALGFVADSMRTNLKALGVWSKALHTHLSEMALRCSYLIFLQHKTQVWTSCECSVSPEPPSENDGIHDPVATTHFGIGSMVEINISQQADGGYEKMQCV